MFTRATLVFLPIHKTEDCPFNTQDGNGYLSTSELKFVMSRLNVHFTDKVIISWNFISLSSEPPLFIISVYWLLSNYCIFTVLQIMLVHIYWQLLFTLCGMKSFLCLPKCNLYSDLYHPRNLPKVFHGLWPYPATIPFLPHCISTI